MAISDDESSEVVTAADIKITVLWDFRSFALVYMYQTIRHHILEDHNYSRDKTLYSLTTKMILTKVVCPDILWDPTSLLYNGSRGLFPAGA